MVKRNCTYSKGSKVIAKYKNGGEVGGIGGGSGVNGSGNSGNGGFGGGGRGSGNGSPGTGGGGKGTGVSTGARTGNTASNISMPKPRVVPTSALPPKPKAVAPKVAPPKPTPRPGFTLPARKYGSVNVVGGLGALGIKGGPADKPVNRQDYKNNVVGGRGVPGYGGGNRGK